MGIMRLSLAAGLSAVAFAALAQDKPKEINACDLLTDQEVSEVIGRPVEPAVRRDAGYEQEGMYSSTCLWRVAADKGKADPTKPMGGASFAILNVQNWPAHRNPSDFLKSFRVASREKIISSPTVELSGIGDEALWWGDGVAVKKGSISFGMSVHLVDDRDKRRPFAEELAKKVAPRL